MRKNILKYCIFISLILLVQCSSFLRNPRPSIKQNFPKVDTSISYELVGWKGKENKIKATEILKALHRTNKFKEISHFVKSDLEWKIQIILDESPQLSILLGEPVQPVSWVVEKRPTRFFLYIKIALPPILILLFFQCAGFYNKPEKLENTVQKNFSTSVRIEFTGFGFYEKELNLLKAEILRSGFKENKNSPLLLEILLEEKEVTYNYKFLHVLNMVTSIFSASLIPYYTITQHKNNAPLAWA